MSLSAEDELFAKLLAEDKIDYDEFQTLLALKERIEDFQDTLGNEGVLEPFLQPHAGDGSHALAIVVGHTRKRPGAMAVSPIDAHEYTFNLDLSQQMQKHCKAKGIASKVFTRDVKGISGAYQDAIRWGATFAVELHFNAFNNSAHGTETLYDQESNEMSKTWAIILQRKMLEALSLRDRGLKEVDSGGRGYRSLSAAKIPIALVEPFFGDNRSDAKVGAKKKSILAKALADAAEVFISPTS